MSALSTGGLLTGCEYCDDGEYCLIGTEAGEDPGVSKRGPREKNCRTTANFVHLARNVPNVSGEFCHKRKLLLLPRICGRSEVGS
jgi:hypothetical protein